jgi:ABC-type dipeptide/oligopeptide/nickel transport system permease subunit
MDPSLVQQEAPMGQPFLQTANHARNRFTRAWKSSRWRNGRFIVSFSVIALFIIIGGLGPLIAPYDPYQLLPGQTILQVPNLTHWLGTDELGRSVLSRMIYGANASLKIGIFAVGFAVAGGVALGLTAAYYGGIVDMIIMRAVDFVLCLPIMIVIIALVAFLGSSINMLIMVIGILSIPGTARIVYTTAISIKQAPFIEAARAIGATDLQIISRHILPNCIPPLLVHATLSIGFVILTESGLSFLGLGPPPPTPTWGQMISAGRIYFHRQPVLLVSPMLTVSIVILALNVLGDALRDLIDPRIRKAVEKDKVL